MEPNKFSKYTVITRKGSREPLDISIVRRRMEDLAFGLNLKFVNLDLVVTKVQQGIHDEITTIELDNLAAETCAYMVFCV
jgi:ribonucleoside-diphosphate reductase subunit M1